MISIIFIALVMIASAFIVYDTYRSYMTCLKKCMKKHSKEFCMDYCDDI